MKLLLKQILIADTTSPHHLQTKDVLIDQGIIKQIADQVAEPADKTIDIPGLTLSPGWVDTYAHFNDPGFEHKETLESGALAAAAGGFTSVFVIPNTSPVISNKAYVEYIVQKARTLPVNILPLGSVTKDAEGKELAEMYDMRNSGAVAFSDGNNPVQTPGILLKALQYVKAFNGVIVQVPVDQSIGRQGLMNEGITSTRLGLPGMPAIAEELIVSRDIELAKYTNSRLHISGVSTSGSLRLIEDAKNSGAAVTCSATPYHLYFCDEDVHSYDTNLKVNPPLRSKNDRDALRKAVLSGLVDCIASHHLPQDWDHKTCEFEYARFGMIGLETAFSVVNTLFPEMPLERLTSLFQANARTIFKLGDETIREGANACLTLFNVNQEYTFGKNHVKSRSFNTPFIGSRMKGKVVGIINKERVYLND